VRTITQLQQGGPIRNVIRRLRTKSGEIKLEGNDLDDLQARVYGDTAVVTGRSTQKGKAYGQDAAGQYRFTRVYVRQDGKWKAVAFQSTKVAE